MQYFVKMSCGHAQLINISGNEEHIKKKIKLFNEKEICRRCFRQMQFENMVDPVEVKMTYHEYKIRYRNFPYRLDSYNEIDKTVVVYLPKELAGPLTDREAALEQARLEREEKKRLNEQLKAERAAARAAALAAKKEQAKTKPAKRKKPKKPPVPEVPLNLRPAEATLFLKRLAGEYNKMYLLAGTELQKRDIRIAYGRLHLFYSSYGKKDWERLVANNDVVNLSANKIVQLAEHIYNTTEKDRIGCVKR